MIILSEVVLASKIILFSLLVLVLITLNPSTTQSQFTAGYAAPTLPASCGSGQLGYKTASNSIGLYYCNPTNIWNRIAGNDAIVQIGTIIFTASTICPLGYVSASGFNLKPIAATLTLIACTKS